MILKVTSYFCCCPYRSSDLLIKHKSTSHISINEEGENAQNIWEIPNYGDVTEISEKVDSEHTRQEATLQQIKENKTKLNLRQENMYNSYSPESHLTDQGKKKSDQVETIKKRQLQQTHGPTFRNKARKLQRKKRPVTAGHQIKIKPKLGKVRPQTAWRSSDAHNDSDSEGPETIDTEHTQRETKLNQTPDKQETKSLALDQPEMKSDNLPKNIFHRKPKESKEQNHPSTQTAGLNTNVNRLPTTTRINHTSRSESGNTKPIIHSSREFPEPLPPVSIDEIKKIRDFNQTNQRPKTSFHPESPKDNKISPSHPFSAPHSPSKSKDILSTVSVQLTGYPAQRIQVTTDHQLGSVALYLTRSYTQIRDSDRGLQQSDNVKLIID